MTDKWEEINIEEAPMLAAFAWTSKGANTGQILVLGGTDGTIIQESAYEIDFKNGKCMELSQQFEQSFAMSKLVYRKQTNTLMVFGGYGSGGQNFEVVLKEGETWQECKRNHSPLLAVKAADSPMNNVTELVNFSGLHFD